jgi:hypothetical protein
MPAMLNAVLVVVGAVAAWLLVDRLLSWRNLRRADAESEFGPNRTFHSTGWEQTMPPLEANDAGIEQLRQPARERTAA